MAKKQYVLRAQSGSYRVAGQKSDGVKILTPNTAPTHFTRQEIKSTITKVLRPDSSPLRDGSKRDRDSRKA